MDKPMCLSDLFDVIELQTICSDNRAFSLILGPESRKGSGRDLRGFCLSIFKVCATIGKRTRSNALPSLLCLNKTGGK